MMNDIMFELNNLMGSVITGWFDDKVLVGYERIQKERAVLDEAIEKDWLVADDKYQLELMFENVEIAFKLRYGFYLITDANLQRGFETQEYFDFKTNNNLW